MTPDSDLRYPIGRFSFHDPPNEDRATYLVQLSEAPANLRAALAGLTEAHLDTPYRPEGWAVRQVAHHLADAHMNWYIRTKLAVTEDNPVTKTYNEQAWSDLAEARISPVGLSLALFEAMTARWSLFFASLAPEQWKRRFQNAEWGSLTVEDVLRAMAWHTRHHTAHITELRRRNGW